MATRAAAQLLAADPDFIKYLSNFLVPAPFSLSLGGISISLIPDRVSGEYISVDRAVDFQSDATPEIVLQVHSDGFLDLSQQQIAFQTAQGWQLFYLEGKSVLNVRSPSLDPLLIGVFQPDFRSGDFYQTTLLEKPGFFKFPLSYPMGELYMMNLLGTGLGMLFHASGVIDQGKGYLFTGNGGAGKTTTSRLWQQLPGVKVVNDDKVIVRQTNGEYRMFGTPWPGEGGMALPDSAPLSQIFLLKQAKQNSLRSLSPIEAASGLFGRAFIPLWDEGMIANTLKFLDGLCQAVPCHELNFVPDASAVEMVRKIDV